LLYCDPGDCLAYEQIALDSIMPEYNICKIAGSRLGTKHSAQTRKKMSVNHCDVKGANNPFFGKKHSRDSFINCRGEKHFNAKLTKSSVRKIKHLLRNKITQKMIAREFGVSQQAVSRIKHGKTWGHI
jgi:DNA-binding Xre family transcriptional regulator